MLFELARSLRSLTRSPLTSALNEAHKMARRYLESGGPAGSTHRGASGHTITQEFVLPTDIEPVAFAKALRAKLGDGATDDDLYPLERKLGGRLVLRGRHILTLGEGRADKGHAFLNGLLKDLRTKRWLTHFPQR
jgi:hypothetical protein